MIVILYHERFSERKRELETRERGSEKRGGRIEKKVGFPGKTSRRVSIGSAIRNKSSQRLFGMDEGNRGRNALSVFLI